MIIKDFVEYVKQVWKNRPDTSTPMSAERLNHMEDGIKGNSDAIKALADATPATAVVGQILEVEEVDDNGVPTKFKAVDNKGGGGSADWDVNDENADGYVKNRTHWKRILQTYELLCDEMVVEFTGELNTIAGIGTSNIVAGTVYTVYWNGTAYECTATSTYLGNGSLISVGDDTGEPFCFEYMTATGSYVMKSTSDAESVTIKVERPEKIEWNQMDPRYIPDMYYTEYGEEIEYLPATDFIDAGDDGFIYMEAIEGLSDGGACTVTYNGVRYECVAERIDPEAPMLCLGNYAAVDSEYEDNGYPFCVLIVDEEFVADVGVGAMLIPIDGAASVNVAISGRERIVHPIDEIFLPKLRGQKTITINLNSLTASTSIDDALKMDLAELKSAIIACDNDGNEYDIITIEKKSQVYDSTTYSWLEFVIAYDGSHQSSLVACKRYKWQSERKIVATNTGEDVSITIPLPEFVAARGEYVLIGRDYSNDDAIGWYPFDTVAFNGILLKSTTTSSTKKFMVTVDDTGELTVTQA